MLVSMVIWLSSPGLYLMKWTDFASRDATGYFELPLPSCGLALLELWPQCVWPCWLTWISKNIFFVPKNLFRCCQVFTLSLFAFCLNVSLSLVFLTKCLCLCWHIKSLYYSSLNSVSSQIDEQFAERLIRAIHQIGGQCWLNQPGNKWNDLKPSDGQTPPPNHLPD